MAFVAERNELLEAQKKKWDERMLHRRDKEVEYMKSREKRVEDYENQLQHLRIQDAEEYNMVKIRLETDVQVKDHGLFLPFFKAVRNIPIKTEKWPLGVFFLTFSA